MASQVDICNLALSHVGDDAVVSALDGTDTTVQAGYCARFYPMALRELLEQHPFTFAKKRAALSLLTDNPSDIWPFAYALPSDMLKPVRVLQAIYTEALIWSGPNGQYLTADELTAFSSEKGGAEFEIEGTSLLTREEDAVLIYTSADGLSSGRHTPAFNTALSYLLAAYLAGPIIKGSEAVKVAMGFRELVYGRDGKTGLAGKAFRLDAARTSENGEFTPGAIRARA